MKLSITILLAAAMPAAATARVGDIATTVAKEEAALASILIGKKKPTKKGWDSIVGLDYQMQHVVEDGVSPDKDGAVVKAYTEAFQETFDGMEVNWAFGDSEVSIPEAEPLVESGNVHWVRPVKPTYTYWYFWFFNDAFCRFCPNDDDDSFLAEDGTLSGAADSFMTDARWAKVGPLMCDKLRATGLPKFAVVDHCALVPTYAVAEDAAILVAKQNLSLPAKATQGSTSAQMVVRSVHLSKSTNAVLLAKAFQTAYNTVHASSDFHVTNFKLEREVIAGSDDKMTAMYSVKADWTCADCKEGESTLPGFELQMHTYSPDFHKVFESVFCHNLRSSQDEAFSAATGCSITFE
jgi:hypothetical protein